MECFIKMLFSGFLINNGSYQTLSSIIFMKNLRGMNYSALKHWLSIVFLMFFVWNIYAQETSGTKYESVLQTFDEAYGVDFNLVNGVKFVDFYATASGHPWFSEPEFGHGWLIIDGKKYFGQELNYDVYNQIVVAEHDSKLLGIQRFIVPDVYLDEFHMNGRTFRKMTVDNKKERIYEVVSEGHFTMLISYEKTYNLNRNANDRNYRFSNIVIDRYILFNDELKKFKRPGSFRKCFPKEIQDEIKRYMKDQNINFKRSGLTEIRSLMQYINSLV